MAQATPRRVDGDPDVAQAGEGREGVRRARGRGWFVGVHCITRYVKVAFRNGTSLRPMPPVESKNAGTRYLHIHEGEPIDEALVARWIRQAAKLPGEEWS